MAAVQYQCSCRTLHALPSLYWCRHCAAIRCPRCVLQEVDSYFCSSCLDDHMPSSEANLNRNRCAKCLACPLCTNKLQTVQNPDNENEFFYACGFCQWNSRASGVTGSSDELSSGEKTIAKCATEDLTATLVKHYRTIAEEEVRAQDLKRHSANQALYRRGRLSKMALRTTAQLHSRAACLSECQNRRNKIFNVARNEWVDVPDTSDFEASQSLATRDIEPLPASAFTECQDISEVATLEQRLRMLDMQPQLVRELRAMPRALMAKRSKRCKSCLHNLIKPELSPTSIKYKMQLFALYNVPTVQVSRDPELRLGEETDVIFMLTNPLDQPLEIMLTKSSWTTSNVSMAINEAASTTEVTTEETETGTVTTTRTSVLLSQVAEGAEGQEVFPPLPSNAEFRLPVAPIAVKEHDPVQEMSLDEGIAEDRGDNAEFVIGRQGNNVFFKIPVTPLQADEPVTISFRANYSYKNAPTVRLANEAAAEATVHEVSAHIQVVLGVPQP